MAKVPRNLATQMERLIESAPAPGRFISYSVNFDFVRDLEAAEEQIAGIVLTDSPRAVSLYESFLAGCYAKAAEIDDSSGSFAQFVGELFCGWIRARQASDADPDNTSARLLAWMDNEPYGFCHQLEKDVAKLLDKAGLVAFEKLIRMRFEVAGTAQPVPGQSVQGSPDYQRRRCGEMLRAIYLHQKDVEPMSHSVRQQSSRQRTATHWQRCSLLAANRCPLMGGTGLTLDKHIPRSFMESHDLARFKCELLTKLGRRDETMQAAWVEFCKHPSESSCGDLMKYVSKAEHVTWYKRPSKRRWVQTCIRSWSYFFERRKWTGSQTSSARARIAHSRT